MGFSLEDIKKYLKLKSTSMISRWERGQSMPSGENLLKLSILYKTLVNELYFSLSKEYQAGLFPSEKHIVKPAKKKSASPQIQHKRLDRGP